MEFTQALELFIQGAQAKIDNSREENHPIIRKISIDPKGRKYKRIVVKDYDATTGEELSFTGSVFCFVDMTNGDVLKAAGWASPAKGARSNIYNECNGVDGITEYGAKYRY